MSIVQHLAALALGPLVGKACQALGIPAGEDAAKGVVGFLSQRFADHSLKLTQALETAQRRSWQALELALAGDSWWNTAKAALAPGDEKALAGQIRTFLAATPLPELDSRGPLRQRCLKELRAARQHPVLKGRLENSALLRQAAVFARYQQPAQLVQVELALLGQIATGLEAADFKALGWLLKQRPAQGSPLLVLLVRYFFRREIETDPELFRGLVWDKLEQLNQAQEAGFAALAVGLTRHGDRLEALLTDVQAVAREARDGVQRVEAQLDRQQPHLAKIADVDQKLARLELVVAQLPQQFQQLGQDVQKVLLAKKLSQRVVSPRDSVSLRSDGERHVVRALVERYRKLPAEQRQQLPALLNAIGKLEVLAGDLENAQEDFRTVTRLVADPKAQAEAHFNAYQAALERGDHHGALHELLAAVRLDAARFSPFPVGKYTPERILGAGGFGVAFLCKHKYMDGPVVVKSLRLDDLERGPEKVFAEAQALRRLDHPGIIRIQDCGYVDPTAQLRPYFVMDYFAGLTLEQLVATKGPLSVDDLVVVARSVGEALHAAHQAGILHRDVKPGNLLVERTASLPGSTWQVKLIDFGLAVRQEALRNTLRPEATGRKTSLSVSLAGTLDYSAPEQMGRLGQTPVDARADVYAFGRTCCFALFGTPQPSFQHWRRVPEALAELLGQCVLEDPQDRPTDFGTVLESLKTLTRGTTTPSRSREPAPTPPAVNDAPVANVAVALPAVETQREIPIELADLGDHELNSPSEAPMAAPQADEPRWSELQSPTRTVADPTLGSWPAPPAAPSFDFSQENVEEPPQDQPRARRRGNSSNGTMACGGCLLVLAVAGVGGMLLAWAAASSSKLASADRLWANGETAAAVTEYKGLLAGSHRAEVRPELARLYRRVIDYEAERGNTNEALNWIRKARFDFDLGPARESLTFDSAEAQQLWEAQRRPGTLPSMYGP